MKIKRRFDSAERREIVEKSQQCLWSVEGKPAIDYLHEKRQLSDRVVRAFGLGYLPSDLKHQLAGRIVFPFYDASGNLVVVSSRLISGDSELPVYWHESYEKSFFGRFGLNPGDLCRLLSYLRYFHYC